MSLARWLGLALIAAQGAVGAQSAPPTAVDIPAGTDTLRGRLFDTPRATPLATLVLFPGFGGTAGDVLGLGASLSRQGVQVLVVNNRGVRDSQGTLTWQTALADAPAIMAWLRAPAVRRRLRIDAGRLVLAGHSFGGALAVLSAAADTSIRRVISIAGADHATYARRMREDPAFRAQLAALLAREQRPGGVIRFDPAAVLDDLMAREPEFAHPRQAGRFIGRSVLLVGGWDDQTCVVERELLPFFRALQSTRGADVTLVTYRDGHDFAVSREALARDVLAWLQRTAPP